MPRCCLNFQSMHTQAESTYIAHNMFGQIKMEIPNNKQGFQKKAVRQEVRMLSCS